MILTYICSDRLEDRIRVQLRFRNFADAINRSGFHRAYILDIETFIRNAPDAQKVCEKSDVLIIYRYLYGPVLKTIQYWKAREKKVIIDIDQAFNILMPINPDYSFWLEGKPLIHAGKNSVETSINPIPLEQFKWGLGMVDAATVASVRLINDWSHFTRVYELPDYLNTSQYPTLERTHEDEVWIGLDPTTQYTSFKNSGLAIAMEHICRKHSQVRLVLYDQKNIMDAELDIDPAQIITYSPNSFNEWVTTLLRLNLGLAPVFDDFDLRLSSINLLEFMIAKVPWIATNQVAFHHLSRYGLWVQNSPDAWESAISKVVAQLDFYRNKANGEPFLYALGQDVGANIEKVLRIYSAIINS